MNAYEAAFAYARRHVGPMFAGRRPSETRRVERHLSEPELVGLIAAAWASGAVMGMIAAGADSLARVTAERFDAQCKAATQAARAILEARS